ncbi:hypothetical protein IC229_05030 [Spirosoma sp. BT702]|uniref:Uncharacterized protein n=1 Tax=Spirosoma profusum TaxID=2771354 RepID=A0A927ATE3_9BACT|nr:hypothetical protein [Spirosoma profusum]MBD2699987.1 hypothetical protein [Spirosoma profusum]
MEDIVMKLQLSTFVLFLVAAALDSTPSLAQTNSIQPQSELEASREANQLSEEVRRSELHTSEVQKGKNHSADAMHWNFISVSQPIAADNKKSSAQKELSATKTSAYEQVNKSVKAEEKPIYN